MLNNDLKKAIAEADRYARWKKYRCLVPGCEEPAILSHAISKASIIAALADNGVVYSLRQSFSPMIRKAIDDPMDVVEVGVNYASVFRGFCANHDARLFAPIEHSDAKRRRPIFISLHLRGLALEYCRNRRTADFFEKMSVLTKEGQDHEVSLERARHWKATYNAFGQLYLDNIFAFMGGSPIDQIEWVCIPFNRNLQVSCCGVFAQVPSEFASSIVYNLLSYPKASILVLTIFKVVEHFLDSFLGEYLWPVFAERMLNDISFSKGEEPLIAPALWRRLSDGEKREIGLSLRHPEFRADLAAPRIIKLEPQDLVPMTTGDLAERLPPGLADKLRGTG